MRVIRILLSIALFIALAAIPMALAEQAGTAYEITAGPVPDMECMISGPLDSDTALQGYFEGLLGFGGAGLFTPRNLGGDLTGLDQAMYDILKTQIASVAAGELDSTEFVIQTSELGLDRLYTAGDLGVEELITDGKINSEALAAMDTIRSFNLTNLARVLMWDCPYELYWFDKTVKTNATLPTVSGTSSYLRFKGAFTIRFPVAAAYATGTYAVDTEKTSAAPAAAANARAIAQQYAGVSDYDKLLGFKETICNLTDYNNDATGENVAYGDPWQVIWVFDGDPETTVVCEGYSKAFQYLCDMTEFEDDAITCYCASGVMEYYNNNTKKSDDHMWNIVHMPTGKNYLVDLTNCDDHADGTRAVGWPDKLFMMGCDNGTVYNGYTFSLKKDYTYKYKTTTAQLFSNAELTLSNQSYLIDTALPIDGIHFPDEAFRACLLSLCDADGNGLLDLQEIAASRTLDVRSSGIASLEGIVYLTALESLDCSDNALTSLDISENAALAQIITLSNRTVSGSVKTFSGDGNVLSCDLGVRLISGTEPAGILTLPAGLTEIGEEAFEAIAAERVVVSNGCSAINARAFAACPNLSEVCLPASVTDIAEDAFDGSPDVFIISPSASVRQWASNHGINSAEN